MVTPMAATHVELKTYIDVLSQFIASSRRLRLQEIARSRCDKVAVLLENVLDTGNENAIARTMEGLGFHRLYRLRNDPKLYYPRSRMNKLQRTDAGARKWLIKHTTEDVDECIRSIRRENYQLACAIPTAVNSIFDVTVEKKTAFVFGNESNGVSQRLCDESDVKFSLPMSGFVESYNVSVAAAITLFHAHTQLKKRQELSGDDQVIDDNLILRYYVLHLGQKTAEEILKCKGMKPLSELELNLY